MFHFLFYVLGPSRSLNEINVSLSLRTFNRSVNARNHSFEMPKAKQSACDCIQRVLRDYPGVLEQTIQFCFVNRVNVQ